MPREENLHSTYKTHGILGHLNALFHAALSTDDRNHDEKLAAAQDLLLAIKRVGKGDLKPKQLRILTKLQQRYPDLAWSEILSSPEPPFLAINLQNLQLHSLCGVKREEFSPTTPVFAGLFTKQAQTLKEFSYKLTKQPIDNMKLNFYGTDGLFHPYSPRSYPFTALNFLSVICAYEPPPDSYYWSVYLRRPLLPLAKINLLDEPSTTVTAIDFLPDDKIDYLKLKRSQEKPLEILSGALRISWTGRQISQRNFEVLFKETFSC